jgi:DNA-binding GntR family transcriptional regulator
MLDGGKISRRTLHDELSELIRAMIVGGELCPGQRIPEQELCPRFGVSRTPLREALKVLSVEGLVRLLPNRAAIVVRITRKEADDLVSVLGILEAFAGELVCDRIDKPAVAEIRAMYDRMNEFFRDGQKLAYLELNCAIHRAIIKAAGSETLAEVHHMLETRLNSVLSSARNPPPRWEEAVQDLGRMIEALESEDGATFALLAREHIQHTAETLNEAVNLAERNPTAARKSARRLRLEP